MVFSLFSQKHVENREGTGNQRTTPAQLFRSPDARACAVRLLESQRGSGLMTIPQSGRIPFFTMAYVNGYIDR